MEFVFVVPREELFPGFYPHGLLPFGIEADGNGAPAGLSSSSFEAAALERGFFVERDHAETNPALKQIIPYGVVCCEERVLLVRRLGGGNETRLHDKLSIGIGGHVNPIDASGGRQDLLRAATIRELEEELHIEGTYTTRSVGVLNDDSNPVGAVHVGLVQVVQVRGTVEIRETDQLEGELVTPDELRERLAAGAGFETWSRLLVERIDELLPHTVLPLS